MSYFKDLLYLVPLLFLAGVVDGIAGGGGLIALPAYMLTGMPIHSAYACNKLQSALGTCASCAAYIRQGFADVKLSLTALVFTMGASFLATQLVLHLDADTIKIIIAVCLPVAAVAMIMKRRLSAKAVLRHKLDAAHVALGALIGVLVGSYDALFGPGGGTVAMILFSLFLNYDLRVGCGNGKILVSLSNITAAVSYIFGGYMLYYIALPCAAANMVGSVVGARIAVVKGEKVVVPVMVFVLVMLLLQIVGMFLL